MSTTTGGVSSSSSAPIPSSLPGAPRSTLSSNHPSHQPVSPDDERLSRLRRPILVYYHIPSDHDDAQHPNAFPLFRRPASDGSAEGVRLRDIKQRFPLPGNYHFRFKVKIESSFFWIDLPHEDALVPQCNNKIIAKVLRVDWNSSLPSESTLQPAPPLETSLDAVPPSALAASTVDDMLSLDASSPDLIHPLTLPSSMSQRSSLPKVDPAPPLSPTANNNWLDDFFS